MLPVVELFEATDRVRLSQACALRTDVFVGEQGVPPAEEIDAHDAPGARTVHALVRDGGRAIATGRWYEIDAATVQIGRMAVERSWRGRGVGRLVLRALMADAVRRGYRKAHLHAQMHAREFYVKDGFVDDGEPLLDADILHQPMSMSLEDYGPG